MLILQKYKFPILTILLFLVATYFSRQVPIWYDEHVFNRFAWYFIDTDDNILDKILEYSKYAYHPPLYLTFVALYSKILLFFTEPTIFLLRLSSSLFTAVGFTLIVHNSLKRSGNILAILVLALLQVQAFYYCFDFGPYPLAFMLSALYLHSLNSIWDKQSLCKKDYLQLSLICILLSYTHYFGTLTVLAGGLVYLYKALRERKDIFLTIFASHFTAMIFFLPWFLEIKSRVVSKEHFEGNLSSSDPFFVQIGEYLLGFSAGSMICALLIFFISFYSYKSKRWPFLVFTLLLTINILRSSFATSLLAARYNIPILPFLFYAFSLGLTKFFPQKIIQYLFLGFILLFTPSFADYNESLSHRWFDLPNHYQFINSYLNEHPPADDFTIYAQVTSIKDEAPYRRTLSNYAYNFIAIKRDCDVASPKKNDFLITFKSYCKETPLNTDSWQLLYENRGTKTWRYLK